MGVNTAWADRPRGEEHDIDNDINEINNNETCHATTCLRDGSLATSVWDEGSVVMFKEG